MKLKRIISIFIVSGFLLLAKNAIAISTISVDDKSFYAVNNSGNLITWEFGAKEYETILENVKGVSRNYAIKDDGTLWVWGDSVFGNFAQPTQVMSDVKDIGESTEMTFIVKNDNSLWAVGSNTFQYMGVRDNSIVTAEPIKIMNNVSKALPGDVHGAILKTDGSVITTGSNYWWGVLGIGKNNHVVLPRAYPDIEDVDDIYVGEASVYAFKNDELWMWGTTYEFDETNDIFCQYTPKNFIDNVRQVSAQNGYNLILMNDGSLWLGCVDNSEKFGYTETDDGPIILLMPYHLMNDVYCITNEWYGIRHTTSQKALIFANDGKLYEFNVSKDESNEFVPQIKESAIKDIRRPDLIEVPERKNYQDIGAKPEEIQKAIKSLSHAKILEGVSETKFAPDKAINRAETAALLLRMTGKGNETAVVHFTDVPADSWYYGIAGASQKYNIFDGYEDNTFRGEEPVSDLQLSVLAARTLKNEGTAIEPYPERSITLPANIPDWAADDISYAIKYGIMTEEEAGELSDTKGMTRGEAAVILYRLYCAI